MPPRQSTTDKTEVTRAQKRITLPIEMERYTEMITDCQAYRHWLDDMISQHPELFPTNISEGYTLHDIRHSAKLGGLCLRRIGLKARAADGQPQVFTIAPSGVMPYCTGLTDDVEKALFLRRFAVPFWALAYVFGRDAQYWYRLETQFGRYQVVPTTVKDPTQLPRHLLADEKVTWLNGQEVVVATTVGGDCVLGASVALGADTPQLTAAYQHFKDEAQHLDPTYQPTTVNTDGWEATPKAWRSLFSLIIIIECFLHAFIKIRERAQHLHATFHQLAAPVWTVYHAVDAAAFRAQAAV